MDYIFGAIIPQKYWYGLMLKNYLINQLILFRRYQKAIPELIKYI